MERKELKQQHQEEEEEEEEEDIICLDESFFINDDYKLTTFTFGSQVLELYCLQSAASSLLVAAYPFLLCNVTRHLGLTNSVTADFDLTGQLVWPGAVLLNDYLSKNADFLQGCSALELGSGVGITGVLCRRYCRQVVLTDHNDEVLKILKKNIELHSSSENDLCCAELKAEKLEWGNSDQLNHILQQHPDGFDLILGADICFQQLSVPLLFDSVKQLLLVRPKEKCKFILAYVSRAKVMDALVVSEAIRHGLQIDEIAGTRSVIRNLQGVIYEITSR